MLRPLIRTSAVIASAALLACVTTSIALRAAPANAAQNAILPSPGAAVGDEVGAAVATIASPLSAVVGAPGDAGSTGAAYLSAKPATSWDAVTRLVAPDPQPGDRFGAAVAMTAALIAVGSPGRSPGVVDVFAPVSGGWQFVTQLAAFDGVGSDEFGAALSVSGSTLVVGAPGRAGGAGGAYVFSRSSSGAWSSQGLLRAPDTVAGDRLGTAVAVSGSTAILGAPERVGGGIVSVFTRVGTAWAWRTNVTGSAGTVGGRFGAAVALNGTTAVVGAPDSAAGAGAVDIGTLGGTTWTTQASLTAPTPLAGERFGSAVAIGAAQIIVGAPGATRAPAVIGSSGAVLAFARRTPTPVLSEIVTASDAAAGGRFGAAVAISAQITVVGDPAAHGATGASYAVNASFGRGTLVGTAIRSGDRAGTAVATSGTTTLVGAPGAASSAGTVTTFALAGGTWIETSTLGRPGASPGDSFGASVAVAGALAVVGAPGANDGDGDATVYGLVGSSWVVQATLAPPAGTSGGRFGWSVAASGTTIVIGAPGAGADTGAAFAFSRSKTGVWSTPVPLPVGGGPGDRAGEAVAVAGTTTLVGAPGDSADTGRAMLFTKVTGAWGLAATLRSSDGAPDDRFGSAVAVNAANAMVGAPGRLGGGAAYSYLRTGVLWPEHQVVTGGDLAPGDRFGTSIGLLGTTTVVIGAPGHHGDAGAAYKFGQDDLTIGWTQRWIITAPSAASGDGFGTAIATVSTKPNPTLVVGSPGRDGATGAADVNLIP